MFSELRKRINLPLMLTLGGMITLGITTTILGFVFWDEPEYDDPPIPAGWMKPNYAPGAEPDTFPPLYLDGKQIGGDESAEPKKPAEPAGPTTPASQDAGPDAGPDAGLGE